MLSQSICAYASRSRTTRFRPATRGFSLGVEPLSIPKAKSGLLGYRSSHPIASTTAMVPPTSCTNLCREEMEGEALAAPFKCSRSGIRSRIADLATARSLSVCSGARRYQAPLPVIEALLDLSRIGLVAHPAAAAMPHTGRSPESLPRPTIRAQPPTGNSAIMAFVKRRRSATTALVNA